MRITRLVVWTGIGVAALYLACAGGRITSSDGHTMFLLTRSLVADRNFSVPDGNAEQGPDGKLYPKAGLGQAAVSVPFYAVGVLVAQMIPVGKREFVVRAATSVVTAFAGALLAAVCLLLFLELGLTPREAFVLTLVVGFATPIWVYSKLYLAETLLSLYLTMALYGVLRLRNGGGTRDGAVLGAGLGLAGLTKYAIVPTAAFLTMPLLPLFRHPRRMWFGLAILGLCMIVALYYNGVRTGHWLQTGYGRQGTADAFTTPILVGLYGLLLSSGKGILWFAPIVALVPAAFVSWFKRDRAMALSVLTSLVASVLLYAGFEHWAGDGSWGPRYIVPLIPLAVAAIAARLGDHSLPRRRLWWTGVVVAGALGFVVQIGGVFISFGAQMREAGDYPYSRAINDPQFMTESHWNPYFSPIGDHWKLLIRNTGEHLAGKAPRVSLEGGGGRIGLNADQAQRLTRGFDIWPAYAIYSGMKPQLILGFWSVLLIVGLGYLVLVWRDSGRIRPQTQPKSFRPDSRKERLYQAPEPDSEEKESKYLRDP